MKSIRRFLLLLTLLSALQPGLPAHAVIVSYTYDAAGRLNAVNYNGTSRTGYGYDKNGNLLTRTNTTSVIPSLAGNFNGLVTNPFPNELDMGAMTLKLSANGSFTGKVTLNGIGYAFAGTFAANGAAPAIVIDRKPPLNDFTLILQVDLQGGTQQITGTITDTVFLSNIQLDRAGYNTTTQLVPAGLVGKYTALFLRTENTAGIPQGDGYATVSLSNAGAIMLAGKLANNVGITQSSSLVGTHIWPLFIPLHTNKGYVIGHVTFVSDPDNSDFDAYLDWIKPVTTGTFHPAAFQTHLTLIGSKWDAPLKGQTAIVVPNSSPNLAFNATEGNLPAPVFLNITLDAANKFIVPTDASKLKLTLTTTTGVVTGSFIDTGKTRTLGGVLIQDWNSGSGFFPGTTASGLFEIEQTP